MAKTLKAQTKTAIFNMKKGVDVPEKFDGAEIKITLAADTDDAEQAMTNMLGQTNGDVQAVIDAFNSQGAALTKQKAIKDAATAEATVEDLQKVADTVVVEKIKRGRGGKRSQQKAKAAKMESVEAKAAAEREKLEALKESDPAAYEARRELMESLGLL